jgi:penicillin amidase
VTRDARGVPTLRGKSRTDVARALGFVHAQDRLFQMDLLRRKAAGELAEVFGRPALVIDRTTRMHRFRALAQQVVAALPADQRQRLEAYADGVNAGIRALGAKPFEYLLTRSAPAPWKPEDSVLVIYAMTLDLQDATDTNELALAVMRDKLGLEAVAFFSPTSTPDDAALDGSKGAAAPIPSPASIDLRTQKVATAAPITRRLADEDERLSELQPGSNSFALSGAHTANGSGLLANDPHLNLAVPNIWYRAVLEWPETGNAAAFRRIVGVSLPGLPFIVLGSNGHVAWGLTDAYADTNDLVAVDVSPASPLLYKAPGRDDFLEMETHRDVVHVSGGADEVVESRWTIWGPVIAHDFRDRPLAHHWVAYDPAATNLSFLGLEDATTVAEAVSVAHASAIPAHNFLVVDRTGDIAWTIAGRFPRRVGFDGRLPVAWTYGDRHWDGYVFGADVPTVSTSMAALPKSGERSVTLPLSTGRLWTANNRLVGGRGLALLGDGGYAAPARAVQIRDQLNQLEKATPADFLAIQRDNRGLFLEPWRELLLKTLSPDRVAEKNLRALLRTLVEKWDGRAAIDSVSYRLVHAFRLATADLILDPIFASCREALPVFDWRKFNFQPGLLAITEQRPAHLLNPKFESWDAVFLAAADQVVADIDREGEALAHATWGNRNRAQIRHPLARSLPLGLGRFLNLPNDPLPGDAHMPLIQSPTFGASMRLVVSPGHEEDGLFQMPGGQSGHPLSAFYRAGHEAWVHGTPEPLLPGPTRYTLLLTP